MSVLAGTHVPGRGEGSYSSLSHSPQLSCFGSLLSLCHHHVGRLHRLPEDVGSTSSLADTCHFKQQIRRAGGSERWLPHASWREGLRGMGGVQRGGWGGQPLVGGSPGGRRLESPSTQHRLNPLLCTTSFCLRR